MGLNHPKDKRFLLLWILFLARGIKAKLWGTIHHNDTKIVFAILKYRFILWSHKHNINKVFVQVITLQEDGYLIRFYRSEAAGIARSVHTSVLSSTHISSKHINNSSQNLNISYNEMKKHVSLVAGVAGADTLM